MNGQYPTAAQLEAQIARNLGWNGDEANGVPAPQAQTSPAKSSLVSYIDLTAGVLHTIYGPIQLPQVPLAMILGLCATAMREHLEQQLEGLRAQFGLPNMEAQALVAQNALTQGRNGGPPPMPNVPSLAPGATGGHNEGEEEQPAVRRLTREEALGSGSQPNAKTRARKVRAS